MVKIKAIFFDFGSVLVRWRDRVAVLEEIARVHKGDIPGLRAFLVGEQGYSPQYQNVKLIEQLDAGLIGAREFYELVCRHGNFEATFEEFREMYGKYLEPIPEVVVLAKKLAARYAIVGVTNSDPLGMPKIEAFLATVPFRGVACSYKLGYKKPHNRMWQRACGLARVFREEAIFVDDILEYVESWKRFGGQGICFDATRQPVADLVLQLQALGVVTD